MGGKASLIPCDFGNDAHKKPPVSKESICFSCLIIHCSVFFVKREHSPPLDSGSKLRLYTVECVQKPDTLLLTAAGIDGDDAALPVVRLAQIFIAQPFTRTVEPQQRHAQRPPLHALTGIRYQRVLLQHLQQLGGI